MRRVALTVSVIAVAALTIGASQEKPDFSGTWTTVADATKRSTTMVVTQSTESMMLEITQRGRDTVRLVFPLDDGTDGKNPVDGATQSTQAGSHAAWKGSDLVLSTAIPSNGTGARTLKQTWSLVDGNLVITSTEINQATGAVLRETKQTFKKG
jgi:hypothetical protein